MNIDTSGPYSPDKVYGQLTMPFKSKPVHINAHTPYDDVDSNKNTVISKRSSAQDEPLAFYNNNSSARVSIEDIRNIKPLELDDNLKVDIGIKQAEEFPPKPKVSVFQASSFIEGAGVVNEALKNGYSCDKAIVIGKAFSAYKSAASFDKNAVQSLLNTNFSVKPN